MNIEDMLLTQKIRLEGTGYKVAYICLHGSQNYGLDMHTDDYDSDFDMKAIVVPTLDDLITNSKPISTVYKTEWGQCDVKDIRVYFETLLKANPAYIETLFTPFHLVDQDFKDEFSHMFSLKEKLVFTLRAQFIRAMYGMMCEKEKAMCHPYPTIAHKIEKFGYDGKQVHHIQRLWVMMQDYFYRQLPLSQCFYPDEEEIPFLIGLKLNTYPLNFAKQFVGDTMAKAKEFKDGVLSKIDEGSIDYSIKDDFLSLSKSIIKNKIVNDIRGQ